MNACLLFFGLVALGPDGFAMERDAIIKDNTKLVLDLSEVLKSVKDRASAEEALPKLKQMQTRLEALKKREGMTDKMPEEEYPKLFAKHKAPVDRAIQALAAQKERIRKLDGGAYFRLERALDRFDELNESMVMTKQAYIAISLEKISRIDKAIQAFKSKNGELPESLNVLAEGKKPFLDKKDLTDPWGPYGQPFQYDRNGPKNGGKMPDVWTRTPEPERMLIGNWPARDARNH